MRNNRDICLKISGYTLLEVMVALIIIGISITAVTGALSTSKGLSARADHAIESVRILKNILNNPQLMKLIVENKKFQQVVEGEDGWILRSESSPLIINSSDFAWGVDADAVRDSGKNKTGKQEREKKKKSKGEKASSGEEIEVPGMVSVTLCVRQTSQLIEKEYCVSIWKRQQDSVSTDILAKPVTEGEQ